MAKKILGVIAMFVVAVAIFNLLNDTPVARKPLIAYSDLMTAIDHGDVREVVIREQQINVQMQNGITSRSIAPTGVMEKFVSKLLEKNIKVSAAAAEDTAPSLVGIVINWLPYFISTALWWWLVWPLRKINATLEAIATKMEKLSPQ